MKKRINLLLKQKNYYKIEVYFRVLRWITYVSILIFTLIIAGFFIVKQKQKNNLDALLNEKQSLLKYFVSNKDYEAELIYFAKKNKQLQEYYKEDVRLLLLPYYKLFTDSLNTASGTALNRVTLGKDRSVGFTLSFNSYQSFRNFFEFAESDRFLDNFDELRLSNFSVVEGRQADYQLGFSGRLKQINEANN